jgi:hypothetical protein
MALSGIARLDGIQIIELRIIQNGNKNTYTLEDYLAVRLWVAKK